MFENVIHLGLIQKLWMLCLVILLRSSKTNQTINSQSKKQRKIINQENNQQLTILTATISRVSTWVAEKTKIEGKINIEKSIIGAKTRNKINQNSRTEIYFAKGAAPDLATQLVLSSNNPLHKKYLNPKLGF